jgi:hypothetical protein
MAEDNIAVADPDTAALHAAVLDARKIALRLQQRLRDATVNRRAKASSRRRKRRTRHR